MTTDEFENPDQSPVPPHDRTWRHPAELANAARESAMRTAPPLGRRLTAIAVFASVIATFVVLGIALPRGIQEFSEDDLSTTTTVLRVKGNFVPSLEILSGTNGSTSAISLGNHYWLVATESLKTLANQLSNKYDIVKQDIRAGVSVIRVKTSSDVPALDVAHVKSSLTSDQLVNYTIVDAFRRHEVAPEPSLSSQSKIGVHPINMSSAINGVALALDRKNRVVGVLVRHDHAQWSLTRETILTLAAP